MRRAAAAEAGHVAFLQRPLHFLTDPPPTPHVRWAQKELLEILPAAAAAAAFEVHLRRMAEDRRVESVLHRSELVGEAAQLHTA